MKLWKVSILVFVFLIIMAVFQIFITIFRSKIYSETEIYTTCVNDKFDGEGNPIQSMKQNCEQLRPEWVGPIK